jgi:hypothetical protein
MSKVESIEQQIEKLSPAELAAFDAEAWDRQFEANVKAGKLDALADKVLHAHAPDTYQLAIKPLREM